MLAITNPQNHPDYRFFHETGEEQFHTFVGIPLQDRSASVGVLVIQTRDIHHFSDDELATLTTIAFQVASIVVNARLLDTLHRYETPGPHLPFSSTTGQDAVPQQQTVSLYGKMAYPGIVTGPVTILDQDYGFADIFDECNIDIGAELTRLDEALRQTRIQTLYLEKRVASQLSQEDAAIFHTHLMILEDRGLIERLHHLIEERHSAPVGLEAGDEWISCRLCADGRPLPARAGGRHGRCRPTTAGQSGWPRARWSATPATQHSHRQTAAAIRHGNSGS